ncbi:putative nuclease HARBI1 [Ornithodoros turicata]|uniref:putative nuclease HARBI1 n=1 Tax=Ornithodoros turicata TaxID=34597 RepID=UPI00313915FE
MAHVCSVLAAVVAVRSLGKQLVFRSHEDAFCYSEQRFRVLFRLPKEGPYALCEELRDVLRPRTSRRTAFTVETKVLAALRFYATGIYQRSIAQDMAVAIYQSAVSRCISAVSKPIAAKLLQGYCAFPRTEEELVHIKKRFAAMSGMPGCIGAIDCTHIAIIAPSAPTYREAVYVNRKGYHSLNVQMVCDADLFITIVNARYPGSTYDSFIWRKSTLHDLLQGDTCPLGTVVILWNLGF